MNVGYATSLSSTETTGCSKCPQTTATVPAPVNSAAPTLIPNWIWWIIGILIVILIVSYLRQEKK